jgi:hypothetical protein
LASLCQLSMHGDASPQEFASSILSSQFICHIVLYRCLALQ